MNSGKRWYQAAAVVYWLVLGAWFGAVLMVPVFAMVTFATVRGLEPTLHVEPFDRAIHEGRGGMIVAGAVVNATLAAIRPMQVGALAVLAMVLVVQHWLMRGTKVGGVGGVGGVARVGAKVGTEGRRRGLVDRVVMVSLLGAGLIVAADGWIVWPTMQAHLELVYHAASPEAMAEARETFDGWHKLAERLTGVLLVLLAILVAASAWRDAAGWAEPVGQPAQVASDGEVA